MESEVQGMKGLRDRVGQQGRTRCMVSDEELVKMMERGLVAVKVKRGKRTMVRQREWETAVQKAFHGAEWLKCGDIRRQRGRKRDSICREEKNL